MPLEGELTILINNIKLHRVSRWYQWIVEQGRGKKPQPLSVSDEDYPNLKMLQLYG